AMLRRAVARINAVLDEAIRASLGGGMPPLAPALAAAPAATAAGSGPAALGSWGVADITEAMRTLWGVPKYRTSKPKKQTRKFSYTRLLTPIGDITTCESCGHKHEVHTICGNCYERVRALTNNIKKKMLAYNPYKGELPPKELKVLFSNDDIKAEMMRLDEERKGEVKDGVRVVELERPRPSWFKKIKQQS
ncbi:hypothetical protein PMAYCL1PPCAC_10106, partial [Pristionchus mayeri]